MLPGTIPLNRGAIATSSGQHKHDTAAAHPVQRGRWRRKTTEENDGERGLPRQRRGEIKGRRRKRDRERDRREDKHTERQKERKIAGGRRAGEEMGVTERQNAVKRAGRQKTDNGRRTEGVRADWDVIKMETYKDIYVSP